MANSRATPVWWRGWTAENDRRPLWLPVALGAGACLYFALPSEPAIALGWAALAAAGALALHYPIKKWAAAVALAGAAFYLVVSGAASPAVRAFLMLAVGLAAVMLDRPALSLRGLGLAAVAILLWRPEAITDPGFQMSFAAQRCWRRQRVMPRRAGACWRACAAFSSPARWPAWRPCPSRCSISAAPHITPCCPIFSPCRWWAWR